METPSSTGRNTRSRAAAECTVASKQEESHSRSRNGEERTGLIDVTNDSPVVGLAAGRLLVEKTASSSSVESRVPASRTPVSGEEVLRGQVRTLLQKVEEDAELVDKLPVGHPTPLFSSILDLARSPMRLLAPTPANTPQIPDLTGSKEGFASVGFASPCVYPEQDDHLKFVQVVAAFRAEERLGPQELLINRTLTFDSPEKSGDEEEEELDGLCDGLKKMRVQDVKHRLAEFTGKHTRFIYNSDDEIEGEEEVMAASPNVLVLKGLPTPEGKHLRFQEEDEED
ncbi:uncharacterized protein LOC135613518 [Musa acuminata AAA Group]|uniref:uncharacterized protein LOC135613518 n=1 Tax=Musa acuminata AAA Group TaxID=214697 RepID=UPI0031D98C74